MAAQAPTEELDKLTVKDAAGANGKATTEAAAQGDAADQDSDGSDDEADEGAADAQVAGEGAAKKKKKKNKKKKKKKKATAQSDPPRVLLSQLFPNGTYPKGEEAQYIGEENLKRTTDAEVRERERLLMNDDFLRDYRHGAETHRQVRQWAQKWIQPGMGLTEIANGIEDSVRALVGHSGLDEGDAIVAGMGFPTGLNLNDIAAHYSPNAINNKVFGQDDVMKIDIGVHVNGRIVDSAFTMAFDHKYDNLLDAVKAATNTGVKEAGIDARLGEIGGAIQETMESYEIELDGKTYPIKSIRNLNGHTIHHYSIHGDKSVPIVKTEDQTKMEEGDVFAIETFGSTGNGYVRDQGEVSHYALMGDAPKVDLRLSSARSLLNTIKKNFGTLPFCRRYLDRIGCDKYLLGLNNLVNTGIVQDYPPLVDKKGSYTAQFEHTILIKPSCKEIISRGDDY
ncbi:putative methionine type metalloexopeptidase [Diaporthe ampelina]|uniref:Methionine aminopeptidase 2 n=1 Tax=Diaporthe ampelina TaxID=1214573 RepID=A0A0G2HQD4_9PEZI|nr:putative methionine type metalloexopeptidase [Diaporthe ampelina]